MNVELPSSLPSGGFSNAELRNTSRETACVCVHACVRACVRVCVHACVRVCEADSAILQVITVLCKQALCL